MLESRPLEPGSGELVRQRPLSIVPTGNLAKTPAVVVAGERAFDMLGTMLVPAWSAA